MICNVCEGDGVLLKIKPDFEYWSCPACCGAGVRVQHGPADRPRHAEVAASH